VADHESGEHQRIVSTGGAGERAAVVAEQVGGQGGDLLTHHTDVHAPLGQVTAVDADVNAGEPYAVQGGHEDVQIVDDLVAVRQERPDHTGPVAGAAQRAYEESALVGLQPDVDVGRIQPRPFGPQPPQVRQWDAELVGQALVEDLRWQVQASAVGDTGIRQQRRGVDQLQARADGADLRGADWNVDLAGVLVAQQRVQVAQVGVAGG